MKYYMLGLSFFMLVGCSTQEKASDAAQKNTAATRKAQDCILCHGVDGKSGKPGVPALGGRPYDELVAAMQTIRDAYNPQPLMAHSLSDEDIKDIATYFSSVK